MASLINIFLESGAPHSSQSLGAAGSGRQAWGVEAATLVLLQRRVLVLCVPGAKSLRGPRFYYCTFSRAFYFDIIFYTAIHTSYMFLVVVCDLVWT